jgi:arrestin-related trafficking adapter 3/6
MRLSRPDADDPTRRRHFEISIDSPFHILSCRATLANTALPAYSSPESMSLMTEHYECGCPNALRRQNSPSSILPSTNSIQRERGNSSHATLPSAAGITQPQAAHVHDDPNDPNSGFVRPIHLLRVPSFNPPAFSDDEPPPPLLTPPPQYESIVNGDPRGGLADYFARLADAIADEEDDSMARSRMELPLTPGGRLNRSMDERRTWRSLDSHIAQ